MPDAIPLNPVTITNNPSNQMPFPLGAAAIGAGGSIISSLLGNLGRKKSEQRARKFNLESWHRQNKYNHPLAQMQRLSEAGLNPNMIYGSSPGSAVGNAGSQVAPGKAAPYSFDNPAIPAFQAAAQSAQVANLSTQSVKNLADARSAIANTGVSKQRLLEMESVFGDYLTKAAGDAEAAKYSGKSAKIKYEIESATKQNQINKIVADANLTGLKEDIEREIRDRAVDGGWIKGDTIGNLMNEYLGVTKETPDWKKKYIALSPAMAAVIRVLPAQARIPILMWYGGSALIKQFDEYMQKQ